MAGTYTQQILYTTQKYRSWLFEQAHFDWENNGIMEKCENRSDFLIHRPKDGEKLYFDDISEVPKEVLAKASLGSRKISETVLRKITNRTMHVDGTDSQGISSSCIDTLIYLCMIQDNKGNIENFRIKSLVGVSCDSVRGAYFVLDKLADKKFIEISCHSKNGYRDIKVLDNDFSSYSKNTRYLNLNRMCFTPCDKEIYTTVSVPVHFDMFRGLSLFAKKLLLYLLFQYDAAGGKRGYRGNMKKLATKLHIKNHSLILDYVKEIKPLCVNTGTLLEGWDDNIHTYKSKKTGSNDVIVNMRPGKCGAEGILIHNAPTALKYKIENIFEQNHIAVVDREYKTPVTRAERDKVVEELSGLLTWHSVHFKDSPLIIDDLLELCENFICECEYFVAEHISAFGIYLREFLMLSRNKNGYIKNPAYY